MLVPGGLRDAFVSFWVMIRFVGGGLSYIYASRMLNDYLFLLLLGIYSYEATFSSGLPFYSELIRDY